MKMRRWHFQNKHREISSMLYFLFLLAKSEYCTKILLYTFVHGNFLFIELITMSKKSQELIITSLSWKSCLHYLYYCRDGNIVLNLHDMLDMLDSIGFWCNWASTLSVNFSVSSWYCFLIKPYLIKKLLLLFTSS